MTGLMLKDLYSLRTYFLKQLGLMTVLYLVLSVAVMKSFAFMAPMLTMSVILMLISSFNVDEASKWDSYALTLPITPKSIVGARYLLFYGALIGTGVLLTAVCALLDSFTFHEGLLSIAAATGAIVALYTLMAAFVLPLFFKLGAEKARVAMTLCFIAPFLAVVWGASYLETGAPAFLESVSWEAAAVIGALVLVLLCVGSYLLSVKFYENKEY